MGHGLAMEKKVLPVERTYVCTYVRTLKSQWPPRQGGARSGNKGSGKVNGCYSS